MSFIVICLSRSPRAEMIAAAAGAEKSGADSRAKCHTRCCDPSARAVCLRPVAHRGGSTMSAETLASAAPARGLRIHLVSPRGPLYRHRTGIWKRSLRYAPLTLTTLASLVPDDLGADVTIVDEGIADVDLDADADLV